MFSFNLTVLFVFLAPIFFDKKVLTHDLIAVYCPHANANKTKRSPQG